nr:hypothetical protein [Tanacetum cinerariifolium]
SNKATKKALISEDEATTNESSMWKMTLFKVCLVLMRTGNRNIYTLQLKLNLDTTIFTHTDINNHNSQNYHRVHTYGKMYTGMQNKRTTTFKPIAFNNRLGHLADTVKAQKKNLYVSCANNQRERLPYALRT